MEGLCGRGEHTSAQQLAERGLELHRMASGWAWHRTSKITASAVAHMLVNFRVGDSLGCKLNAIKRMEAAHVRESRIFRV
jgi:hypothetical protein